MVLARTEPGSSYEGARWAWSCGRELDQGHRAGPPGGHPARLSQGSWQLGPFPAPYQLCDVMP